MAVKASRIPFSVALFVSGVLVAVVALWATAFLPLIVVVLAAGALNLGVNYAASVA